MSGEIRHCVWVGRQVLSPRPIRVELIDEVTCRKQTAGDSCEDMFIIVRFGGECARGVTVASILSVVPTSLAADEEELFNPDCASRVLVENIKKRCDCVERGVLFQSPFYLSSFIFSPYVITLFLSLQSQLL